MKRTEYIQILQRALRTHPVVAILGPRQCGKTTLARDFSHHFKSTLGRQTVYFDMEDPTDLGRLENPKLALEELSGLVVIDEIQRRPHLFDVLRVLVDRPKNKAHFLVLGSASRELVKQSSESLAGRLSYMELTPFSAREAGGRHLKELWQRGGFPRSFLAETFPQSLDWRRAYITTFLERDIPSLGITIPAASLRRFWLMLAHYHGQVFNASEMGRSFGVADTTIRRYLDILSGTFMVRQLTPWTENIQKRQVKSPKIYFRDSGLLHALLGIQKERDLFLHPKLGASWEGFALEEVVKTLHAASEEVCFWATHNQAELDLLVIKDGRRLGFEFKYTDAPRMTKSMHVALQDLKLDQLQVVYPGHQSFPLGKRVEAVGLEVLINRSR